MSEFYNKQELLAIGFSSVGDNVVASRDARLFAITGSLGNNVRIDAFAILTGNIILQDNTHVSPFCFLGGTGGSITMKCNSGMSTHVSIFTKSDDYTSTKIGPSAKLTGHVFVGENSIIGSGSTIMPDVTIGENVNIGCNSVINQNIEKGAIMISRGLGLIQLAERK